MEGGSMSIPVLRARVRGTRYDRCTAVRVVLVSRLAGRGLEEESTRTGPRGRLRGERPEGRKEGRQAGTGEDGEGTGVELSGSGSGSGRADCRAECASEARFSRVVRSGDPD
ncbi:hypothetical protein AXG93_4382s1150 [Marchantia polymorpha subsp. ruderalis]|uniref:Uncharacterized protein n=1 Tax=Marchantia polymorpha subsp. ruderalis TaxID=1480154 RepID=A0A176VM31_MARPO|nr:hypothetical protein AXG93_4382s1150 [Marchantia polymorpha subsp. ruderalis]